MPKRKKRPRDGAPGVRRPPHKKKPGKTRPRGCLPSARRTPDKMKLRKRKWPESCAPSAQWTRLYKWT
jgi:hypothetical protein